MQLCPGNHLLWLLKVQSFWIAEKNCTSFPAPCKMCLSPLFYIILYNNLVLDTTACVLCVAMIPMKISSQLLPANVLLLEDHIWPEFKAKEKPSSAFLPSSLLSDTHHKILPLVCFSAWIQINSGVQTTKGTGPQEQQTESQFRFSESYSCTEN